LKYAIVIFPSKKLQDLVNSYRKRYDPHYALVAPHITLKGAFEVSEQDTEEMVAKLKEIAKKYDPFTLKVSKVKSFAPVSNTIYFKVDSTPELEGLFDSFKNELPGEQPKFNFVPHITIGQKLSNDEHSDVYGQLRLVGIDHQETVHRFHLVYQLENETWTSFETFDLGKE